MYERICLRDPQWCPICRKTSIHTRVKTDKYNPRKANAIYGWECESCGSVRTDDEGLIPKESARRRGMTYG